MFCSDTKANIVRKHSFNVDKLHIQGEKQTLKRQPSGSNTKKYYKPIDERKPGKTKYVNKQGQKGMQPT